MGFNGAAVDRNSCRSGITAANARSRLASGCDNVPTVDRYGAASVVPSADGRARCRVVVLGCGGDKTAVDRYGAAFVLATADTRSICAACRYDLTTVDGNLSAAVLAASASVWVS